MPAVKGSAPSALAKLKAAGGGKAFDAHKADETDYGMGGELPPGINGGVAQLADARIGEYKTGDRKGEPFVYLAGIVKSPAEVDGVEIIGMRASLTMPLMADPKGWGKPRTTEENIAATLNELRKLGLDTSSLTIDDLEAALAALKSSAPHFRFHTYASRPPTPKPKDWKPKTYTNFDGLSKVVGGADDDPGAEMVEDGSGEAGTDAGTTAAGEEGEDWGGVAALADQGDADACQKIKDACMAAGISEADVDNAENWTAAVELMQSASGGGSPAEAANEPWKPEVGHFYPYKPPGARKPVECEVVQVFKETMNMKDTTDPKKTYKGVKWTSEPATIAGQPI